MSDFYSEMTNEVLEILDTEWYAVDDCVLETCCGESVEYDCPKCPECGERNPLMAAGMI